MFEHIESELKAHLEGCIDGVPVLGTYDVVDVTSQGGNTLAMRVVWLGASIADQARGAVNLSHRFGVCIYVDSPNARETARKSASEGMKEALKRMLAFRFERHSLAKMENIPVPDHDGRVLLLAFYFTLRDVVRASID